MMLLERFDQRLLLRGERKNILGRRLRAGMTDREDELTSCDQVRGEPLYPEVEEYVGAIISLASCCLPQVMNAVGGPHWVMRSPTADWLTSSMPRSDFSQSFIRPTFLIRTLYVIGLAEFPTPALGGRSSGKHLQARTQLFPIHVC